MLNRKGASVIIEVGADWAEVVLVEETSQRLLTPASKSELEARYAGTVSPAFRKTEWAPFLKLVARSQSGKPCVFRTTFLASGAS